MVRFFRYCTLWLLISPALVGARDRKEMEARTPETQRMIRNTTITTIQVRNVFI